MMAFNFMKTACSICAASILRLIHRDVRVVAGGIAFFVLLSLFPLVSVITSLSGLFLGNSQILFDDPILKTIFADKTSNIIVSQLQALSTISRQHLTIQLIFSFILTFWSAQGAAKTLIEGVHILTQKANASGIIRYQLKSVFVTISLIMFLIVLSVAYVGLQTIIQLSFSNTMFIWAGKFSTIFLILGFLYRATLPLNRSDYPFCYWGAVSGSIAWLIATTAFDRFMNHSDITSLYGAISGVIIFLLWIYISAYAILFGALVTHKLGELRENNN